MKIDFIPKTNGKLNAFQKNFVSKLTDHSTRLGLDPVQLNESIRIINENVEDFTTLTSKKTESKSATENYYNSSKKAFAEIRRFAKHIKSAKTYTTGIGDDLGIISPDIQVLDSFERKPNLKAEVNGNDVIVRYRKERAYGIKLYCKRSSESEFTFLGYNFISPFRDNREKLDPLYPEQREYYAYFLGSEKEIGQRSDVLKVVVP